AQQFPSGKQHRRTLGAKKTSWVEQTHAHDRRRRHAGLGGAGWWGWWAGGVGGGGGAGGAARGGIEPAVGAVEVGKVLAAGHLRRGALAVAVEADVAGLGLRRRGRRGQRAQGGAPVPPRRGQGLAVQERLVQDAVEQLLRRAQLLKQPAER